MLTLSAMIKRIFSEIYYNIVEIVVLSLIFFICTIPVFVFGVVYHKYMFMYVYMIFVLSPLIAGVFFALDNKLNFGIRVKYKDIIRGYKKYYPKMIILSIIFSFISLSLFASIKYFNSVKSLNSSIMMMFQIYMFIVMLLVYMYAIPIVIKENINIIDALKKSLKLLVNNLSYTFGMFLQIICVSILLCLTIVGFPLLLPGEVMIFLIENYKNVLKKYKK